MSSQSVRKAAFGINALSAWLGFGMTFVIELFGLVKTPMYDPPIPNSQFGHYGNYADGLAGAPERIVDMLSYFTIWSQICVAIVMTMLWLNPARDGKWFRVFRLDSVLMITVTGVVYNILLGPAFPPVGLNKISSPLEHTVTPIITVLVFLFFGPRGWINREVVAKAFLVPIGYVAYTLARGVLVNTYPYDFFDVVSYGYAYVFAWVGGILFASLVVLSGYWAIDSLVLKRTSK